MLGVEPVRDAFGRVSDLKLIPSAELGRPRIDVVVQTSGQLRDIAASRLFLINRAVEMAAAAKDDKYENLVAASVVEAEKTLTEKGVSPKDAREMAAFRVFGGANGMYGTGIQEMVESGDRWEDESEIAATYLNNMGAYYGREKRLGSLPEICLRSRTDPHGRSGSASSKQYMGRIEPRPCLRVYGRYEPGRTQRDRQRSRCLPERLSQP